MNNLRLCLSACSNGTVSTSRRQFGSRAGRIKFWKRDQGYGFVIPDGSQADIFLHRKSILCSHEFALKSPKYPYLKKDERVSFDVQTVDGKDQAVNVSWINGGKVPPERLNFLGGVYERAKYTLGEELLTSSEKYDEEVIKKALQNAKESIALAEATIRSLGMDPKDFPIVKPASGRGRYLFEGQTDPTVKPPRKATRRIEENIQPNGDENSVGNNDSSVFSPLEEKSEKGIGSHDSPSKIEESPFSKFLEDDVTAK